MPLFLFGLGCYGRSRRKEVGKYEFWILQGSSQKPLSVDTLEIVLWHRNSFTVTEKYFILWQRNTVYSERKIFLLYVTKKYFILWQRNTFISPPPPNISIWKAGSQKFSHHFYLGHNWKYFTWQTSTKAGQEKDQTRGRSLGEVW